MIYQKHRPKTFDEVKGNRDVVAALKAMLKTPETMPHSFLFHGPTGTAKTTLARIVANELGCSENNIIEIDTAQFRGIDTIRDLRKNIQYTPLGGGKRVYIIDECFVKGTKIKLSNGNSKSIEDVSVGDSVCNLTGNGKVTNTFVNKVDLQRVVKVTLSNKQTITCSCDHLFYTNKGWVKAKNLENCFVYSNISCNFVGNIKLEKTQKYENRNETLPYLQNTVCLLLEQNSKKQQESLQQEMCGYIQCTEQSREKMEKRIPTKIITIQKNAFNGNREGRANTQNTFPSYANKKPSKESKDNPKSKTNKKDKWNIAYLERNKGGQWEINTTTNTFSNSFRLGNGISNKNRTQPKRFVWISYLLQSRFGAAEFKNSDRSRWQITQLEATEIKRLKKRKKVKRIGVESVAFYKQGNNDRYFKSVIGDKERNQGFVELYDFEVDSHPSYFANGVLVHNCHKITSDAQNAFLKILEDTPKHIYFILCTTDPQSLLPTVKGRCSQFQTSVLTDKVMGELLSEVAEKEGVTLDEKLIETITESSQGHPRNALTILEQVLQVPEKRRLRAAKKASEEKSESIALCRALMYRKSWKEVSAILKGLKGQDPESIRRVVLGYATSVLLNKDDGNAFAILECFEDPTYNIGFPGIVLACQRVLNYE